MIGISLLMFTVGLIGILSRRNTLIFFLSIELMLNAANLLFVFFSNQHANATGQAFVFFVLVVAAAEAAVGLSLVINQFRAREVVDLDQYDSLKE